MSGLSLLSLGMGVSGGEEGAGHCPSLMPRWSFDKFVVLSPCDGFAFGDHALTKFCEFCLNMIIVKFVSSSLCDGFTFGNYALTNFCEFCLNMILANLLPHLLVMYLSLVIIP